MYLVIFSKFGRHQIFGGSKKKFKKNVSENISVLQYNIIWQCINKLKYLNMFLQIEADSLEGIIFMPDSKRTK